MRTPYRAIDEALNAWMRRISKEFNRTRLMMSFDELNVISPIAEMYDKLVVLNRQRYIEVAEKAYDDAYKDAVGAGYTDGKEDKPSLAWVLALLAGYNGVTKYVYDHEVDRKRARLTEAVIADVGAESKREIVKDFRTAESLWRKQTKQYAISIEDAAVIKAFTDAGVTRVWWVTADDEKVCGACDSRDGKSYAIDNIPPKPHYNCRCYISLVRGGNR